MDGRRWLQAIEEHCEDIASLAAGNLGAAVEHCPGWDVAALLEHLVDVHWFWSTIVEQRLTSPPEESSRPAAPERDQLVEAFRGGAAHLVEVLATVPFSAHVWTWAPARQDVGFVARHQVQEAAVHHFDAAHARGHRLVIDEEIAADAVEEFLTFSLSTAADPAEPARPPLRGQLVLASAGAGPAWTIGDDAVPGTLRVSPGAAADVPTLTATASDLLLWLYGRVELDDRHIPPDLVTRFRALTFTD